MAHDFSSKMAWLDRQWLADDAIFYRIRHGGIDWEKADEFCRTVSSWASEIPEDEPLPRAFVTGLWQVPYYIDLHSHALISAGEDRERVVEFRENARKAIAEILGY